MDAAPPNAASAAGPTVDSALGICVGPSLTVVRAGSSARFPLASIVTVAPFHCYTFATLSNAVTASIFHGAYSG